MSDHTPKQLRAAAMKVRRNLDDSAAAFTLADYILATVREDDEEEQPDVTVTEGRWRLRVQRLRSSAWLTIDSNGDALSMPFLTFTRRQFRDLCRGLGITLEEGR